MTPINLTNHAYWNLSGSLKRSAREHFLALRCDRYLPLDGNQVMDGETESGIRHIAVMQGGTSSPCMNTAKLWSIAPLLNSRVLHHW